MGKSGYSSSAGSSYDPNKYADTGFTEPEVPKPEKFKTPWGKFDEDQAEGFRLRPTAMIPRVSKGLTPASPQYGQLQDLPAAEMAMLMGGKVAGAKGFTRNLGNLYEGVLQNDDIPSIDEMLAALQGGGPKRGGLGEIFGGIKLKDAHYRDVADVMGVKRKDFSKKLIPESTLAPGYVYGKEPLQMGEAAGQLDNLVNAVYYANPDLGEKYGADSGWGDYLIDRWGARASRKPAGKGKLASKKVGKGLSRGMRP
jgi:hypothetical protein